MFWKESQKPDSRSLSGQMFDNKLFFIPGIIIIQV